SRVSGERRESALRGDLVTDGVVGSRCALREDLLRTRRDGKPHQGTTQLVCRSHERGIATRQPAASVLLLAGLRVDPCAASPGAGGHGMGAGSGPYHSLALAENRSRGTTQRPSNLGEFL